MSYIRFHYYLYSIYLIFFVSSRNKLYAQRGKSFSNQTAKTNNKLNGVPNFFNTQVAGKGNYIFEIPTMSFDYGISDNFTLGLNLLAPTVFYYLFEEYSLFAKARYNIFSNEILSWSTTLYPFLSLKQTDHYFRDYTITNNLSYQQSENLNFDFSLIFSILSEQNLLYPQDFGDSRTDLSTYLIFVSSTYFLNDSIGMEGNFGLTIYRNLKIDLPQEAKNASAGIQSLGKNFIGRVQLHYKISENRIFSGGVMTLNNINKLIPILYYTWKI